MKYIVLTFLLLTALVSSPVHASNEQTGDLIEGLWLTSKEDAAIQVEICGDTLCGHIAWLGDSIGRYSKTGKPLCQTPVLKNFTNPERGNDNLVWKNGQIYKANDDKSYKAILTLLDEDTMKLRAYIGAPALGKTKILTRANAKDYPPCTVPHHDVAQTPNEIAPASGSSYHEATHRHHQ